MTSITATDTCLITSADAAIASPGQGLVQPCIAGGDASDVRSPAGVEANHGWPAGADHAGGLASHAGRATDHAGCDGLATPRQPDAEPPPNDGPRPHHNGSRRGNPNLAPRCGAKARTTGCACRSPAMANGRCRMHGGKSTGPRTPEGLARLAAAHTTHGHSNAAAKARDRWAWTTLGRGRLMAAAHDAHAYLPRDLAARLDYPSELKAPVHHLHAPYVVVKDNSPCNGGRDAKGRFVAAARPPARGRAADREYARAEAAALAPWKAGIARAHKIKRVLRAMRRAEQPLVKPGRGAMRVGAAAGPECEIALSLKKPHATSHGAGADAAKLAQHAGGIAAAALVGFSDPVGHESKIADPLHKPHATSHGAGSYAATLAEHGAAGTAGTAPAVFSGTGGRGSEIADPPHKPHATSHGAATDAAKLAEHGAAGITGTAPGVFSGTGGRGCEIADVVQKLHATSHGGGAGAAKLAEHGAAGTAGTAPGVFSGTGGRGCEIADPVQKLHATSHGAGTSAAKLAEHGAAGIAGTAPGVFSGTGGRGCEIADPVQKLHATSHGDGTSAAKLVGRGAGGIAWAAPGGYSGPAVVRCQITGSPQKPHATSRGADTETAKLAYGAAGIARAAPARLNSAAGGGCQIAAATQKAHATSAGVGGALCVVAAAGRGMTELDRHEQGRMQRGAVWPPTGGLRARLFGGTGLDGNPVGVPVYGGLPALIEAIEAGGDVWGAIAKLCGKEQG
jgi:hypothetical protein